MTIMMANDNDKGKPNENSRNDLCSELGFVIALRMHKRAPHG